MSVGYKKYDELGAYHWNGTMDGWYGELIKRVPKLFPKKGTILDVGCGDGRMSYLLRNRGLSVVGFDGEEKAIALAQYKVPDVAFYLSDIKDYFSNKTFDYFLAQDVIEHLEEPKELVRIFNEYCDKYMILTTDYKHYSLRRYDYNHFDIKDLEKLFGRKVELLFELSDVYGVKICKKD